MGYSPWGRKEVDTTERLTVGRGLHVEVEWGHSFRGPQIRHNRGPLLSPLWALRTVLGQCCQGVDSAGHSPDTGSSRLLMLR